MSADVIVLPVIRVERYEKNDIRNVLAFKYFSGDYGAVDHFLAQLRVEGYRIVPVDEDQTA